MLKSRRYIQWVTTLSLTRRVYLHSFSSCCHQNLRNPASARPRNSRKFELTAVQGHRSECQSKAYICNFLFVINSNCGGIYRL